MDSRRTPTFKQQRNALFSLFFLTGCALSSWATRTPSIRDLLHASTGEMGLILLGLSSGAMIGLLSANMLINKTSSRKVSFIGVLLQPIGISLIGLSSLSTTAWLMTIGLFACGFGMGSSEISINLDGNRLERALNKTILPKLHGCFSAGTVLGALLSILLTHYQFPVYWHLWIVALVILFPIYRAYTALPSTVELSNTEDHDNAEIDSKTTLATLLKQPKLWMIAIICMAMALAEGSANDWLPLLMVDGHGFASSVSSFIYAGFAFGMTIGRFGGNYFIERYGRVLIVLVSSLSCVIGVSLAIFTEGTLWAILSVLLWGMGTSLGFPIAISAAGDSGSNPHKRVSMVAVGGYCAFLVGPPLLGFLGNHFGLRNAMLVVMGMALLSACLSPATRAPKHLAKTQAKAS